MAYPQIAQISQIMDTATKDGNEYEQTIHTT
jgi:hypothetical protein